MKKLLMLISGVGFATTTVIALSSCSVKNKDLDPLYTKNYTPKANFSFKLGTLTQETDLFIANATITNGVEDVASPGFFKSFLTLLMTNKEQILNQAKALKDVHENDVVEFTFEGLDKNYIFALPNTAHNLTNSEATIWSMTSTVVDKTGNILIPKGTYAAADTIVKMIFPIMLVMHSLLPTEDYEQPSDEQLWEKVTDAIIKNNLYPIGECPNAIRTVMLGGLEKNSAKIESLLSKFKEGKRGHKN